MTEIFTFNLFWYFTFTLEKKQKKIIKEFLVVI